MPPRYPFLRPNPARLTDHLSELREIEDSGIYSNFGPVSKHFEELCVDRLFGGDGYCVTVCNATIGLMIALRSVYDRKFSSRRYALMPSYTFAATAHAALWAGFIPLLCDIDPLTWLPSHVSEHELLERYGNDIAVIVPYATFGNNLDLDYYTRLAAEYDVPVVVDAAASLGSVDAQGNAFGRGFPYPVVYSLHATKTFATAEAGLIYCSDEQRIGTLRAMGNFGFGRPRTATMPGLNAKLSEIGALLALAKLDGFNQILAHRARLAEGYREELKGFYFQKMLGLQHAYQFMPVLLPEEWERERGEFVRLLAGQGVTAAHYFSPHLAEQPYFAETCVCGDLQVTERVSARSISLPLYDSMTLEDVREISAIARQISETKLDA